MKINRTVLSALLVATWLVAGCDSNPASKSDAADAAKPEQGKAAAIPAATTAEPQQAVKEIKPADTAETIRETKTTTDLQRILTELGYKPGPIDGVKGKKTVDALKKFQDDHKLPATGDLDPETVRMLEQAKP